MGWWGALGLSVIVPLGGLITLARTSLVDLYKEIGFREEQLEALGQSRALGSPILMVWTAALGAACVAYTIWLRKYFVKGHRERGR